MFIRNERGNIVLLQFSHDGIKLGAHMKYYAAHMLPSEVLLPNPVYKRMYRFREIK